MRKHAYLIMAHAEPELLKKLFRALDDERNDLYVHIDAKSTAMIPEQFRSCIERATLTFVKRRNVAWAGESQILCEMDLFRKAAEEEHAYYHLMSGADFPVRSQNEIHAFFEEQKGFEFIEFWDRPEKEYLYRIQYRYPLQEKIGHYTNDPKTILLRIGSKALVVLQKIHRVDRVREYGNKVCCGSQWVSLTDDFVRYLLGKESEIRRFFLQGVAADELYKQTVCWNSPFKEKIWPGGHMRLIDWERGEPYTWQEDDLDEIMRSEAMFVRKVSEKNGLVDRLMERIV